MEGRQHRSERPAVVGLDATAARDAALTGAKAAALATAVAAGLPVLPGFVRTTAGATPDELWPWWERLSAGGERTLVVRSSSTVEDSATSSMAGRFTSVLDVRGWEAFLAALDEVVRSAADVGAGGDIAVLVQPFLAPDVGGVLFGLDPVTARRDRVVVAAVAGGPHHLVHGEVDGDRWTLTPHGRVVAHEPGSAPVALRPHHRWALAALARRTAALFGGPQDVEWAIDQAGTLWLLQSRPVTVVPSTAEGPRYGPGPVAETFPDALTPLEEDLWVAPLADGLAEALALAGVVSRRAARRRPLVVCVGGRVAADLDALGAADGAAAGPARRSPAARLDPRPPARRLVAAWRVGRLRSALPSLARDIVRGVDRRLAEVPRLSTLADDEVVTLLRRVRQALIAVHGYEVLAGVLVPPTTTATAAGEALRVVAAGRARGLSDAEVVARHPLALTLTAPRVGAPSPLPPVPKVVEAAVVPAPDDALAREGLRVRVRWLQELGARAAWELGRRLAARHVLLVPADIRLLRLEEVATAVRTGAAALDGRRNWQPGPPLPTSFRLAADGRVVGVQPRRDGATGRHVGVGASAGRVVGPVHHVDDGDPPPGAVLVVRHLEPRLAPLLPRLAAVVAETGSALSHLAILAREAGVPVVVGVPDACTRLASGTHVLVDGATGETAVVRPAPIGGGP